MAPELRPLVIVAIGGGLEQWSVIKPGTGMPNLFVLDYDREGQSGEELLDFAEEIDEARRHLAAYQDPGDERTIHNLSEGADEYRRMVLNDETAGRYR